MADIAKRSGPRIRNGNARVDADYFTLRFKLQLGLKLSLKFIFQFAKAR